MSQLFLFTGPNAYALREEKKRWISEFVKKHGEENLVQISGKELRLRSLLDEVAVAPFIALRRLVVIEGVPSLSKEEVEVLREQIHPHVIALFVDPAIDRRLASSKQLLSIADVKEFPPLKAKALLAWMQSSLKELGASVEPLALSLLLDLLGEDQDMLAEELRKLALFSQERTITAGDIEETTVPSFEGVVWRLTDLLAAGRREEALLSAYRYLARGGDAQGLWAILLSMLKNVVIIAAAQGEGQRSAREIAADLQVHFMAVRALSPYASRIPPDLLRRFLIDAIEADIGLKTGAYRATDEAPQELLALIDRFILTAPM